MAEQVRDPGRTTISKNLEEQMSRFPLLEGLTHALGKEVKKIRDKKILPTLIQNLAIGKISLPQALLELTEMASTMLDSLDRDEVRLEKQEARANAQYHDGLNRSRGVKGVTRKKSREKKRYVMKGQVIHPKTEGPLAGLVVEAWDRDIAKHDLLGVDVTDSQGSFEIVFSAKDFKEWGEKLPEVVLRVGLDRRRVFYVGEDLVKPQPGEEVSLTIHLPETPIDEIERILGRRQRFDATRMQELDHTITLNRLQHRQMQEIVKAFADGLDEVRQLLIEKIKGGG